MNLLTKEIERALPEISVEWEPDPIIIAKFFTAWGNLTWYAIQGHRVSDDYIFSGLIQRFDGEVQQSFFTLLQLQLIMGSGCSCLQVERDLHFRPTRLSGLIKKRT